MINLDLKIISVFKLNRFCCLTHLRRLCVFKTVMYTYESKKVYHNRIHVMQSAEHGPAHVQEIRLSMVSSEELRAVL